MGQRLHQVVEGRAAGQRLQYGVDVAPVGFVGQTAGLQIHVLVAQLETRQSLCRIHAQAVGQRLYANTVLCFDTRQVHILDTNRHQKTSLTAYLHHNNQFQEIIYHLKVHVSSVLELPILDGKQLTLWILFFNSFPLSSLWIFYSHLLKI